MPKPDQAELARRLKAGGFALAPAALARLWQFHVLLRAADAELNLTRIRAFEAIVEKHYLDSLLPGRLVALEGPVMDLGSGGGFPGIPLAIAHPDLAFKLVEGRRARTAFLSAAVARLGLSNVEVVARKLSPADAIPVRTVITRAFADIPSTLARVAASVEPGGQVVFMKGPNCDEEIAAAAAALPAWRVVRDLRYQLPLSGDPRRLVVYRRDARAAGAAPAVRALAPGAARRPAPAPPPAGAVVLHSADNPRVKLWRRLQQARGIHKEGRALLAGARYITELLRSSPGQVEALIEVEGAPTLAIEPPAPDSADRPAPERYLVSPELMRELDAVSGVGPLAVVRAPPPPPWPGTLDAAGLTLFLPAQNPENVGAILRTAEALGVRDVVLLRECAGPYLPKTLRAAGPSVFRLRLWEGPGLAELDARLPLVALDLEGEPLAAFAARTARPARGLGLVVGMEGPGARALPAAVPRVTIPLSPGVDSLNASVAVGIALYALCGAGGPG